MAINYNTSNRTLEIRDSLRTTYGILKVLMLLNMVNAAIWLFHAEELGINFMKFLWIGIGLLSLVVLLFFILRKSTASTIPVAQVVRLKARSGMFVKNHYALELKGGKIRDLGQMKTPEAREQLHRLMTEAGIPVIPGEPD